MSRRPTASAALPPTPASTSSKTSVRGETFFFVAGRADASLERQSHARQLAAGGDLVQGLQLLAEVGRDQERDRVDPALGPFRRLRGLDADPDAGLFHGQRRQFLLDTFAELDRGFLAAGREFLGRGFVGLGESSDFFLQGVPAVVRGFHRRQVGADFLEEREHLLNRRSILALELFEGGQPVFHLIQTSGIGLQLAQVVAKGMRGFLRARSSPAGAAREFLARSRRYAPVLPGAWRSADLRGCTGRIFVQRGISAAGQFLQPDDVAQYAALIFELGVLTGLGRDRLDFLALERP